MINNKYHHSTITSLLPSVLIRVHTTSNFASDNKWVIFFPGMTWYYGDNDFIIRTFNSSHVTCSTIHILTWLVVKNTTFNKLHAAARLPDWTAWSKTGWLRLPVSYGNKQIIMLNASVRFTKNVSSFCWGCLVPVTDDCFEYNCFKIHYSKGETAVSLLLSQLLP